MPDGNQRPIPADSIGYVQAIDTDRLLVAARANDVVIRVVARPGSFVTPGAPLAVVWPAERVDSALCHELNESFLLGMGRTPYQDIELYFHELTEIALRALSPAINDPFTAITCIDWIAGGLSALADSQLPSRYRYDLTGSLRIIADPPSFETIANGVYSWNRNAAHSYPGVMQKLLEMAVIVAPSTNSATEWQVLSRNVRMIDEVCQSLPFLEYERRSLRDCYRRTVEALNAMDGDAATGEPVTNESLYTHP